MYLRTDGSTTGVGGLPWLSEFGFQQTRGFRALKVWMALKYHGLTGYREAIEHDLEMAAYLADGVRAAPDLELLEPPSLSIVCFRYAPAADRPDRDAINALNQRVVETVQLGGQAFLSSTVLDGQFWLRACVVNPRTRRDDIDVLIRAVQAAGEECARLRR